MQVLRDNVNNTKTMLNQWARSFFHSEHAMPYRTFLYFFDIGCSFVSLPADTSAFGKYPVRHRSQMSYAKKKKKNEPLKIMKCEREI